MTSYMVAFKIDAKVIVDVAAILKWVIVALVCFLT